MVIDSVPRILDFLFIVCYSLLTLKKFFGLCFRRFGRWHLRNRASHRQQRVDWCGCRLVAVHVMCVDTLSDSRRIAARSPTLMTSTLALLARADGRCARACACATRDGVTRLRVSRAIALFASGASTRALRRTTFLSSPTSMTPTLTLPVRADRRFRPR